MVAKFGGLAAVALLAGMMAGAPTVRAETPAGLYVRAETGWSWARDSRMRDQSCTSSRAALGCGNAYAVSLGDSPTFGLGIGWQLDRVVRFEALLTANPDLAIAGRASSAAPGDTANRADLSNITGFVVGYLDLEGMVPGRLGPWRPFVGAGVGIARNQIDDFRTSAPSLAASSSSPGGTSYDVAWLLTAGTGLRLTEHLTAEIAYRYSDLGRAETDAGVHAGQIGGNRFAKAIDGTRTDLQTHSVLVGLRYRF